MRKTIKNATNSLATALVFAAGCILSIGTTRAADTWTGATSANWNASNWSGGNNPPVSGDSLIFTSVTGGYAALNDNLTSSSFNLANITFNSGAAAFTVSGNAFNLTGNLTNSSTSLETINDPFSLSAAQIFAASGGGNLTLGGVLSGTGSLTVAGTGKVTLSGANTYAGATTNNGGTLVLNNNSALPATTLLTVNNGGIVDLDGHSVAITNFGSGGTSGLITNSAGSSATLSVIDWTNGLNALVADGANGTVALNFKNVGTTEVTGALNNNGNTFSGGFTIGNAVTGTGEARFAVSTTPVNTGTAGAIVSSIFGQGSITIGSAATDRAQLWIGGGTTPTILNNIVFNTALGSDRVGGVRVDVVGLNLAGTLTANLAPASFSDNDGSGTSSVFLSGQVTGPNGLWLEYNPSDPGSIVTCVLSNLTAQANNYQGNTEVDSPHILGLGAPNQIPAGAGAGYVTNTGTFDLNGYSQTINGLWGNGVVDGVSGTPTLTVGSNNATSTFTGMLTDSGGSLSLIKIGSGRLTLSGANSYAGATTINGGTLQMNNSSALPSTTLLTVNSGGILDLNGQSVAITNFGAGSTGGFITNSGSSSATLTASAWTNGLNTLVADGANGTVALNFENAGTAEVTGALNNNGNTFSGGLTIGNAISGTGEARFEVLTTPVNTGTAGAIQSSIFGQGSITIGNSATDKAQLWVGGGTTPTILNDIIFNTALGSDRVGAIRVDVVGLSLAGTLTANLAPVNFSDNDASGTSSVLLTGQVTGPNGLWLEYNPSDPASVVTCILSNVTAHANNYQGDTEIDSPHILAMGAPNQIPSGSSAGDVTNTGTFELNGYNQTINGLWGSGLVDGVTGTPTLTVGSNNATSTFTGVLTDSSGSLSLTKIGTGTLTLSGQNTHSGATTIKAGVLQSIAGGACSNSAVTVAATSGNSAALGISITNTSQQWTCSSLTVNNAGTSSGLQYTFGSLTPSTTLAPLNSKGSVTFSTGPAITIVSGNLPVPGGNGYPLLTWGSGSAPSLTGTTLTVPTPYFGTLGIVGSTLYMRFTNVNLTVNNGTGSGTYANGAVIPIVAENDPAGEYFSGWVINSGSPVIADTNSPSTTLTIPDGTKASVTATFATIPTPSPISGLGYSLTWNDEFDEGLASIDLNNTKTNGFKWYVQAPDYYPVLPQYYTNPAPSVVRILGSNDSNPGSQLVSAVATNVGFNLSDSNGFYVESRIRILSTNYNSTNSWPAFWLRSAESCEPNTLAPWPGTTNGWQNQTEIDLMEYGADGETNYGSAMHNWYGFGPFVDPDTHTLWSAKSYGGYPTNEWHIYGCLLVPSTQTANQTGYLKMYLDDVFVTGFTASWTNAAALYTNNMNAEPIPSGNLIYSSAELWHHIICLGTARTNSPIDIDWVRVWQLPGGDGPQLKLSSQIIPQLPSTPTNILATVSGSQLKVSWPSSYTGWLLQVQTNSLGSAWQTVAGSYATNVLTIPINPNNPAVFYRLVHP